MAKLQKQKPDTGMVVSAIGIAAELQQIVAGLEANGGECDDETLAALQSWSAALEVKAESIAHVKLRLEADAGYWQQYEDAARAMRKSKESAIKRLTEYLARCMSVAGTKSIKRTDGLFSISLSPGKPSVNVLDEKKIPFEFVTVEEVIKVKTKELKARLEAGEQISGVELNYGAEYVTIRVSGNKSTGETNE